MTEQSASLGLTVKCPNCGSTLEITPDALAYVCKYCGWVGTTRDISTETWMMSPPIDRTVCQRNLTGFFMKTLKHAYAQARILEFKGMGLPIWVTKVNAHTQYNGYRQEMRTETHPEVVSDGRGGRRTVMRSKSYPVYIPVRGTFDEVLTYPIVARRHAVFFGLDDLKNRASSATTKPFNVKTFLEQKVECLDVEMTESEVKIVAESLAEDEHFQRAKDMTSRLFDCYTEDEVLSSALIFYPAYTARYEYRGRSYRVTMDGVTGEVVKAELPMTLGLRIGYALIGYAGVALAIASEFLLPDLQDSWLFTVPMVLGSGLALWSFFKATSEQRIKRG